MCRNDFTQANRTISLINIIFRNQHLNTKPVQSCLGAGFAFKYRTKGADKGKMFSLVHCFVVQVYVKVIHLKRREARI